MKKSEIIIGRYIAFNRFKDSSLEFKVAWSERLNLYVVITEEKIIFADGVEYFIKELATIKGFTDSMLVAQHTARQVFGEDLIVLS